MKYIRELLITLLLIGWGYMLYLSFQDKAKLDKYEKTARIHQDQLDSVVQLQREAVLHVLRADTERNGALQQVKQLSHENETFVHRVAVLKRLVGAPIPTDAEIDSAARRLYKGR